MAKIEVLTIAVLLLNQTLWCDLFVGIISEKVSAWNLVKIIEVSLDLLSAELFLSQCVPLIQSAILFREKGVHLVAYMSELKEKK